MWNLNGSARDDDNILRHSTSSMEGGVSMNHCVRVFRQNVWFYRLLFEERICRIINNYCHVRTECDTMLGRSPRLDLEALWKTKYIFIIDKVLLISTTF